MRIAFGLALVGAACICACGGSKSNVAGSGGADGAAGDTSGSGGTDSGVGDAGSTNISGEAGAGGEAGAASPPEPVVVSTGKPHAAAGLVAGGVVAKSAHFTGVFSLGASPGGNGLLTSSNHQLRGGVLGASQQ
jgi:hypothetical protein